VFIGVNDVSSHIVKAVLLISSVKDVMDGLFALMLWGQKGSEGVEGLVFGKICFLLFSF
jgi:hypothetical protein